MGANMSEHEDLLGLVREADLYRNQGLLAESKTRYTQVLALLEKQIRSGDRNRFSEAIRKKIQKVDQGLAETRAAPKTPDLSPALQGLIKKSFSFSSAKEIASMEGALALAKFGQYEEAIAEFQQLLRRGIMPVATARHLLRCYFSLSLPYAAVAEFKDWAASQTLAKEDLRYIRRFLEETLKKTGFKDHLPSLLGEVRGSARKPLDTDDLKISAIRIQFAAGPFKDESVEKDIISQFGNLVSILIPARRGDLAAAFRIGKRLDRIQCYSPITVFTARGVVSRKSKLERGPHQGDYVIDISIEEK
jgi:tetratricopeptide (TPR) repeat protein